MIKWKKEEIFEEISQKQKREEQNVHFHKMSTIRIPMSCLERNSFLDPSSHVSVSRLLSSPFYFCCSEPSLVSSILDHHLNHSFSI